ncbi:Quinidine resistance protein 1 [Paramyrothecium foliicola]|nr:Quinidine resistance protein 1 [Paramyrothecium foliicola]
MASALPQPPAPDVISDSSQRTSLEDDVEENVDLQDSQPPPYTVHTTWQKRTIVLSAALMAFTSPLSAQIYLPALTDIASDLNVTDSQVNLTITTYMILQGITPMFIGSLADSGGRRPAFFLCFVIYMGANIGLALAPSYGAVLGLRCLQSAGSSSTVALCSAVVADIITSAERGQYVSYTAVTTILAPALGPVIGGVLSQHLGWRSIFWFLTIFAAIATVLLVCFFPETCRHIVGDGSIRPPALYRSVWQILQRRRLTKPTPGLERQVSNASSHRQSFKFKPPNVLGSVFMLFEKGTGLLLGTGSISFAGFYCLATAMPTLLSDRYGYNETETGLMYLPLAGASVLAAMVVGPLINRNFKRHCLRLGVPYDRSRQQDLIDFPIERARIEVGLPLLVLAGFAFIGWGWAMAATVHVAVLCVLSAIIGVGMIGFNNTTNVLLVDMHPGKAGTAQAANNLTRCLVGAGATAAIVPMMNAMGVGWAFTLVGGLYILCIPGLVLLMAKGMPWRAELQRKAERKAKRVEDIQTNQGPAAEK